MSLQSRNSLRASVRKAISWPVLRPSGSKEPVGESGFKLPYMSIAFVRNGLTQTAFLTQFFLPTFFPLTLDDLTYPKTWKQPFELFSLPSLPPASLSALPQKAYSVTTWKRPL